jgi:dipeptidyl aminopeptidase/acylaminoacyl peptidase
MSAHRLLTLFGLALLIGTRAGAATPSIADFAARPKVEDAAISPDGTHVVLIETNEGRGLAVVASLDGSRPPTLVLSEPEHFVMRWCRWATDTRVLCSFQGVAHSGPIYPVSRLVGVDADGKNMRVLIQNSQEAQGQFQDNIINWHPGPKDTVLIAADEGLTPADRVSGAQVFGNVGTHALPAVFELNVVNGQLRLREHARDPIRGWTTDVHGDVRLGWGFAGTTYSYYARLEGERNWRRLARFEAFTRDNHFTPIAINRDDPNKAYAFANFEERRALWLIDLTDKEDPTLVYSNPNVDVGAPLFSKDGALLGVRYDTGYPLVFYTDPGTKGVMEALQSKFPGKFLSMHDSSRDGSVLLIVAYSDVDASTYIVVDRRAGSASVIGRSYPDRDVSSLAPMRSIAYKARDGTSIPGYLSLPVGAPTKRLPLIVLPHGGPIARDTWGYWFLREFLLTRGYAVLQMNFRGSGGFGDDWFYAAHQDWGGLSYDDVVDGARWAVAEGIADPQRVAIVGWSFGGYLALVGAQRNGDLFRCAVDIAGPSDLAMLIDEGHNWLGAETIKRQIGTDKDKLKLNSPRLHAAEFQSPVLIVQGTLDWNVPVEQSEDMDAALRHAGKAVRFVKLDGADHQIAGEKDRATLLAEIETFLAEQLRPAASPGTAAAPTTP